jgi:hypothetical protein
MRNKNLRSKFSAEFVVKMKAAGLEVPKGISLAAMALVREMNAAGGVMAAATSSCGDRRGNVCQPAPGMGIVIKAGWAAFVPAAKHYALTPAAVAMLQEAEAKGIMALLADYERRIAEAESPPEAGMMKPE